MPRSGEDSGRFCEEDTDKTRGDLLYGRSVIAEFSDEPIDVLFLDIEMPDINGIETARAVNEKWSMCQIVYLTNYLFDATEVYHTAHVFYVLKNQFEQKHHISSGSSGDGQRRIYHEGRTESDDQQKLHEKDERCFYAVGADTDIVRYYI